MSQSPIFKRVHHGRNGKSPTFRSSLTLEPVTKKLDCEENMKQDLDQKSRIKQCRPNLCCSEAPVCLELNQEGQICGRIKSDGKLPFEPETKLVDPKARFSGKTRQINVGDTTIDRDKSLTQTKKPGHQPPHTIEG